MKKEKKLTKDTGRVIELGTYSSQKNSPLFSQLSISLVMGRGGEEQLLKVDFLERPSS
jgi:hypothetical protein